MLIIICNVTTNCPGQPRHKKEPLSMDANRSKNVLRGIANLGEQVTSKATRNRNVASKKLISRKSSKIKGFRFHGGIAQLGERLNGIQEVSGSIPLISTNNRP